MLLTVEMHAVTKQESWRVFLIHPMKRSEVKIGDPNVLESGEGVLSPRKRKYWRILLRTPAHAAQTDPVVALGHMLEVTAQVLAERLH